MNREEAIEKIVADVMYNICMFEGFVGDCVQEHVELWTNGQINDYFNETVITE